VTEPQDPFAVPDQPTGGQDTPPGYGAPPPPPPPGSGTPAPPPGYGTPPPQGYGAPPPPGYGAPPGYGQPPYGQSPYGQQPYGSAKTNTLAIVALVASFFCSPAGLICGIIARGQIKERGEGGAGLALAAIIISAVSLAFAVIVFGGALIVGTSVDSTTPGY
jgi:hypothetical protein